VTKGAVWQWLDDGRKVPAEHCPAIERATDGAVRCEELRPDIDWAVLRRSRRVSRAS
jgi:DNA-binding transcriptional regulator YdaS (Cro superfamily)